MNRFNTIAATLVAAGVLVALSASILADHTQSFTEQLAESCVSHGLEATCSLQEAYIAQLDCRDAGLAPTCSIWELSHKR